MLWRGGVLLPGVCLFSLPSDGGGGGVASEGERLVPCVISLIPVPDKSSANSMPTDSVV